MTREELRTRILTHLGDDPADPAFWRTDEIDAFITEAQEIAAEEVRAVRKTVFVPRTDGVQIYDLATLDTQCMAPYRVYDHTANRALKACTMRQLDRDRYRWLSTTGTSPLWWYPVGYGRFGIHPAPGEGSGLLRVDYLAWPDALTDDEDTPDGSEADHDTFVLYGAYLGLLGQFEAVRGTERFVRFTEHWKDAKVRNDMARLQSREPQRRRG